MGGMQKEMEDAERYSEEDARRRRLRAELQKEEKAQAHADLDSRCIPTAPQLPPTTRRS